MSDVAFDRRAITQAIEAAKSAGMSIGRVELQYDPRKIVITSGHGRQTDQRWFVTYKHRNTPREKAYYYHTKTKLRLHGEPGTPEFIKDFEAAEHKLASDREKAA